jgi:hypothetical protein
VFPPLGPSVGVTKQGNPIYLSRVSAQEWDLRCIEVIIPLNNH